MPTTYDDRVSILIDGREFTHWDGVTFHLQMDSFASVDFGAPFESRRSAFRSAFRPFSFKPLEASIDGERLIYGTLVGVSPSKTANASTVAASGYSKPGVLADSACPTSLLPLEFRGYGLRQIANAIAEPFGILVIVRDGEGAKFAKVKAEVDQRLYDFLSRLVRERNRILTSDADGNLVIQQSTSTGSPVARLVDGREPVTKVQATFDPRAYYSHLTSFTKQKRRRRGSRHTVRNPFLDELRPMSFTLNDTDPADAPEATRAKLGRMFANAATYTVDVATWRDPSGRLWAPNTTVTLQAPDLMVYRETELLVRAVVLSAKKDERRATLQLVLPGAFTGEVPEVLPWDE